MSLDEGQTNNLPDVKISENARRIAKRLSGKTDIDAIERELFAVFDSKGTKLGLQVMHSLISMAKSSISALDKAHEQFESQCDVALKTLACLLNKGNLTAEERSDIVKQMMEVLEMSSSVVKQTKIVNDAVAGAGVVSVSVALGLVAHAFIKQFRK